MGLLKSDLRISAGLLKEAAPDNHLLAYITPNERDMLVQAGGSGHITKSGIPSFESSWDSSVDDGGWDGYESGPPDDSSHDFSNDIGDVGNQEYTPPAHVPDYESGSPENTRAGMSEEMADRTRELTQAQHEAVLGDHGDPLSDDPKEQAKYARYVKHTIGNQPLNKTENLTFKQHWDNAPEFLRSSIFLRGLYAAGKNIGEWARSKGWNWDSTTHKVRYGDGNEVSESDMQRATASEAPHIIGGTTQQSSQAAQWYANLGSGNTSPGAFDLTTQYAKAKSAVSQRLKSTSSVGQIAVSNSAFFDFLKDNSLNKGIL